MKKLIYLALVAIAFIACKVDEPKPFVIDPLATVNIKPAAGTVMKVKAENNPAHLTALEIVKQTTTINFTYDGWERERTFAPEQRDTISTTPKLLMWATDVISAIDGSLQPNFIEANDVIFRSFNPYVQPLVFDTIAYIPNSVLRTAEVAIKSAYEAKDIEACYTLFNTAYSFTPITGAEWLELKRQGLN